MYAKSRQGIDIYIYNTCKKLLEPQSIALDSLVQALKTGFQHGHVYCMDDVLEKYFELLLEAGANKATYRSHKLKEKLMSYQRFISEGREI